jgi:hypothetical protein
MVRTEKKVQDFASIYVVSEKVKEVLTSRNSSSLKVVNTGVKAFAKNGGRNFSECAYRICSDGVQTLSPHLSMQRRISISLNDLVVFIKNEYPKLDEFSKAGQDAMNALSVGSCLLQFDPSKESNVLGSLKSLIVLPFFKAQVSVSLLLDKAERKSLLNRLTGEELVNVIGLSKPQNQI